MSRELDRIDRRILDELQANGRLSIVDLATKVNLTNTPCSERVKRLEKSGFIKKYSAIIDPDLFGYNHLSVVQITMDGAVDSYLDGFNRAVQKVPEIETCLLIAGSFDYVLIIRTRDIGHYRELLGDKISKLPGVRQTNSFAVMEVVKETKDIAIESLG